MPLVAGPEPNCSDSLRSMSCGYRAGTNGGLSPSSDSTEEGAGFGPSLSILRRDPDFRLDGRGPDVVVSCAGPVHNTEVPAARAAVAAGSSYVSLCDEYEPAEEVLALSDEALAAGVTVVSGCGLSPGITNLLVAHAAPAPEAVYSIQVSLAASSAETDGDATARHLLYALSRPAPVVRDGRLQTERGGSAPRLVFFPEPIGWVETFNCGHPETLTMRDVYPNLSNLNFRLGLSERVTMDTARAFAFTPLARSDSGRKLLLSMSRPLRPLIDRLPPRGAAWSGVRVDVRSKTDTFSLGVADRMTNLTSVPLTLAALRLGRGDVKGNGVLPVEKAFEVGDFLKDMVRRGIGVGRLEPAPV